MKRKVSKQVKRRKVGSRCATSRVSVIQTAASVGENNSGSMGAIGSSIGVARSSMACGMPKRGSGSLGSALNAGIPQLPKPSPTWTPEPLRRKLADRRRPEIFKSSVGIISDRRKHDRRAR